VSGRLRPVFGASLTPVETTSRASPTSTRI
jgi:hypothetical protein